MKSKIILSPELAALKKEGIPQRVIRQALNRTAKSAKAAISKEVRKIYNIKKRDFDKHITVTPARNTDIAVVAIKGKRLPLFYFLSKSSVSISLKRKKLPVYERKTKTGRVVRVQSKWPALKVKVKRTEGWKVLRRNAFIARMKSGHIGIFRRMPNWKHKLVSTNPRKYHGLPIAELTTLSSVQMVENSKALREVEKIIPERLRNNIVHSVAMYLYKKGRRR
ncbi:Prophage minor tail protein Z (GPZ) [Balnearium lithotrophicum]|uniref:Prophage minor tail protein Z (GPZ) n=1 Tax=Balnearium lithotrophicum TaxID=223788 RepID=A0A521CP90_9BACT|nr:phage tail protein [Balnearium lithotrophicum]SMO61272.1 Prophage minor tail protein Z (GPZ) [Balnearium lithotrophicum]